MTLPTAILRIRSTPGVLKPKVGTTRFNELHGGPDQLLDWLETQLGLVAPAIPNANRVTELANSLDGAVETKYASSLATDRWATSSNLLMRRDQLRMACWDDTDNAALPKLVQDLSHATAAKPLHFPDTASRLQSVRQALADGQRLPPHRCILEDPIESWSPAWRLVLEQLVIEKDARLPPAASPGSALRTAQEIVNAGKLEPIVQDPSLRFVTTRSETAACEFVAAALAQDVELLPETVVYCENDAVALRLDACLNRAGLPTMGASAVSRAHPVLQVLPLSLALCWDPVDPQVLLDFLTLPVSPIPRRVARVLVDCLVEQPGLGSARWEAAIADLCHAENDPDGKVNSQILAWLMCPRVVRGTPVSSAAVRTRCGLLAQWATGRALLMLQESEGQPSPLSDALQAAAGHAVALGELVEVQGKTLTEPQLTRLLEEVTSTGVAVAPYPEAFGGAQRVRTLAEIDAPFKRLVWLGLGTADAATSPWPVAELASFNSAGIDLDDGSRALTALRSAEARGFSRIAESLLAILLPQDLTQRWHPLWLAIRTTLHGRDEPQAIDDLFVQGQHDAIHPYCFKSIERTIIAPPPPRALWQVPADLLQDRDTVSASELQDRLGCPLKWVFNYQAKIRPGSIAALPDDFQLKGTFCHSILQRLFGDGGELPTVDEAIARVGQIFDERLPLDAAPIAQPHQVLNRRKLRTELINATRVLVEILSSGGYRIHGIEVEVEGEAFGKRLVGSIDCLAVRDDAQQAVIDFKYAGRRKYRELLETGRAVQLATYAHGRSQGSGQFPAVAYLVLADAQLYTPSGSPLACEGTRHLVDGPGISTVWDKLFAAIQAADGWLTGNCPIPARPLQLQSDWPRGCDLVLEAGLAANDKQDPCRYCDYGMLCGREVLL